MRKSKSSFWNYDVLVTLNDKPRSYNCKRETIVTAVTHTSEPCRNLFAQENWFRVF